jgi:hypothetical protein
MKHALLLLLLPSSVLTACNHELPRTKFIHPRGWIGEVTIYYNKPNGQKAKDKDGWIIQRISDKGECFSALPYEAGWIIPHKTWKFYEIYSPDSMTGIDEFDNNRYVEDLSHNANRKYVFFTGSGSEQKEIGANPNWFMTYKIDSGKNYKKYNY